MLKISIFGEHKDIFVFFLISYQVSMITPFPTNDDIVLFFCHKFLVTSF